MKKLLALVLALAMTLGLSACGGSANSESTGSAPEASTPAETSGESSGAPAESAEASGGTGGEGYDIDASLEHITIRVATSRNEGDFVYTELQTLCQYVEEHSNGTISFEYYPGGTFCSMPEEFDYVASGAVDMIAWFEGTSAAKMPLWQFSRSMQSNADALAVAQEITVNNAETAGYLMAEAEANQVHPLGGLITGNTMFVSTEEADSLADLAQGVFGTARSASFFEALGLNVISVENADLYESLSRGLITGTSSAASGVISGKYYEVAPYCMLLSAGGLSAWPTLNLTVWNSLTEEQQRLFEDAYAYAVDWAMGAYEEELASYEAEITGAGGTYVVLSEEDNLAYMTQEAQDVWNNSYPVANDMGVGDQFRSIMEQATELCGISIDME